MAVPRGEGRAVTDRRLGWCWSSLLLSQRQDNWPRINADTRESGAKQEFQRLNHIRDYLPSFAANFFFEQTCQDRFLRMQPVLSFVDYHRSGRIDNTVSNNYITSHWQAVHEDRVVRTRHLLFVDNPLRAILGALLKVTFRRAVKVFRSPAFRIDNIRACKRVINIVGNFNPAACSCRLCLNAGHQAVIELVALGMRND